MPISTDDVSVGGGSTEQLTPIMTETHTVLRVKDRTQQGFDYLDGSGYDPDLGITVVYDIDNVDTDTWDEAGHSLDIHGNLDATRDPSTGEITAVNGVSGAFKVLTFFKSIGVDVTVAAGNVAPSREALEAAQGRVFTKLRFVTGESEDNVYFDDYDIVAPIEERDPQGRSQEQIEQDLKDRFLDDYENGYQDRFSPDVLDTGFSANPHEEGTGAPSPSSSKPAPAGGDGESEGTFEPDDDLPF